MTSSRLSGKILGALIGSAALLAVTAAAGMAAAGAATGPPQGRHMLRGSTPRWLSHALDLGGAPSSQPVSFGVLLRMRDPAGAASTLRAISDPGSASYGHWLSNAEFDSRYGPAPADVTATASWLRSQG